MDKNFNLYYNWAQSLPVRVLLLTNTKSVHRLSTLAAYYAANQAYLEKMKNNAKKSFETEGT